MFQHLDLGEHLPIPFPALDAQGPLAHGMERNGGIDQFMDAIPQPQAPQACCGQDQAIKVAGIEFFEAGDHIAPHVLKGEVGVMVAKLGEASQGAGAHHAAGGQGGQGLVLVFGMDHQGIGRIFPLGDAAEHQALGQVGGQILEAVHGDVGQIDQHLGLQFLGEQALVADLGEGHIQNLVALGGHGLNRDLQAVVGLAQLIADPMGLHHGQLAAAGGDTQGVGHQCRVTAAQPKD